MLPLVLAAALSNLTLAVDARDVTSQVWKATEHVALDGAGGPLTLVYPKWIPGAHGPVGPIAAFGALRAHAGDATVSWTREADDPYAFTFDIPAGTRDLRLDFAFFEGDTPSDVSARLAVLDWNDVVLYPKGGRAHDTRVTASIDVPDGWSSAVALDAVPSPAARPEHLTFAPTSLETLVDSPLYTGRYGRVFPLYDAGGATAELDAFAESAAALAAPPAFRTQTIALVNEALAAFGARHWQHYHFLLELSDDVRGRGLEHHSSSENGAVERALVDDDLRGERVGELIAHEFTHSWCGKYRRPAGLATPDYQHPMRDEDLWVYEGLTTYYGEVLAARAGYVAPAEFRDRLANTYADLDAEPGRLARPLLDTAVAQGLTRGAQSPAGRYQRRGEDYYGEASLMWLEADTLIRERTGGKKSLDDVAHLFLGGRSGPPAVVPYTRTDLIGYFTRVLPYDWRGFFRERVDAVAPHPPSNGFTHGGYRLAYSVQRSPQQVRTETETRSLDARFSLGARIAPDGTLPFVIEGSPLGRAGLGPAMKILAVNDRAYSTGRMRDALAQAAREGGPLQLTFDDLGAVRTAEVDYHGGERYPHLVRVAGSIDRIDEIAAARTNGAR